ncbi:hypothetical protein [Streptomyces justiciae]|uniref:Helix-turn-helix domain-containing protein n=1 Tax=Streptomyces justiciae TaxID=2780140 RepID=A0ABU3M6V9_9ACTN|nr:hypothetical protein [Streptomyces justiciae]MDT7847244.1 hypothetical protein [Streptomyces justiciae]
MSAPATPRIPTPGDLARRPALAVTPRVQASPAPRPEASASAVARLAGPGQVRPGEVFRQMFQQGMRISRMQPHARLVGLTLLAYANYKTGLLNKYEPNSKELSYATGLTEAQALVQLEVLAQRGWLTYRTLSRGPRQGREVMQLCVPALVLEQLRRRRAAGTPTTAP